MHCQKCDRVIDKDETREWNSQRLCEDCYIDMVAPAPSRDHWKVLKDVHNKSDY